LYILASVGSSLLAIAATPSGENADSVGETVVPVPAPDPEDGIAVVSSEGPSCNAALFLPATRRVSNMRCPLWIDGLRQFASTVCPMIDKRIRSSTVRRHS